MLCTNSALFFSNVSFASEQSNNIVEYCLQDNGGSKIYFDISTGTIIGCYNSTLLNGIVNIPNEIQGVDVKAIGDEAFWNSINVTSFIIPGTVTNIGDGVFSDSNNLTEIVIPDSVTNMGTGVFKNCKNLTKATLSASMEYIPEDTFSSCINLTEVSFSNDIISIGDSAFSSCWKLDDITIPNSVKEIGRYAFSACYNFTHIDIPKGITTIKSGTFNSCNIKSVTIPDTVISIEDYAFSNCDELTYVEIPSSVAEIKEKAFWGCGNLKSINIPGSVKSIGENAFNSCTNLSDVIINDGVVDLPDSAFWECPNIKNIVIPTSVTNTLTFIDSLDNLETASISCSQHVNFRGKKKLKNVTFLGDANAYSLNFSNCTALSSVVLPKSLERISPQAFWNCTSLLGIELPNNLKTIGYNAFSYSSLMSINIPAAVTEIEDSALEECVWLCEINVADKNEYYASIDGVLFDKQVATLMVYPSNKPASEYTIPDGVTTLQKDSFYNAYNLDTITIPKSVIDMEKSGLFNSTVKTVYCYRGSVADDFSLYPDGVTIIYIDDGETVTSENESTSESTTETTIATSEPTTEITTNVTTTTIEQTTTEFTTLTETQTIETTTEITTVVLDTVYIQPVSPNSVKRNGMNVIDYSEYKDKEVIVNLMLSNVENTVGINNFTFFVEYNPKVMKMTGIYSPESLDGYVVYKDSQGNKNPIFKNYRGMSITSCDVIPKADDSEYADVITSGTIVNNLTCAELGKVKFANYIGDVDSSNKLCVAENSGIMISIIFELVGEGDSEIYVDLDSPTIDGINPRPSSERDITGISMPGNIIIEDIPNGKIGDINNDEMLSANDAATVLQKALDASYKMPCEALYYSSYMSICDVNGDGVLTANDAAYILQKTLDSNFIFPVEK